MAPRPIISVIGAGQLGSRHLQALHAIRTPLDIRVTDPSPQSLDTAKARYESLGADQAHQLRFAQTIDPTTDPIDVAIVATSADARRSAIEGLLKTHPVKYFILEKYLFNHRQDYQHIADLLSAHRSVAWINCSMRTQTIYQTIGAELQGQAVDYSVTGSQYGLITNAIHFLDYLAYLTGQDEFSVDTSGLDPKYIPSKRKGFLELNGRLVIHGQQHSHGTFSCYPDGQAPIMMSFTTPAARYVTRDAEQKAYLATAARGWTWSEIDALVPFQSAMTTAVIEQLLADGTCRLAPYALSMKLHLTLLDALQQFMHQNTNYHADAYPFT